MILSLCVAIAALVLGLTYTSLSLCVAIAALVLVLTNRGLKW